MSTKNVNAEFDIPDHVPDELVYHFNQTTDPDFAKDPYAVFKRIVAEAPPIFYNPNVGEISKMMGPGSWTINRAAIARDVLQRHEDFETGINYPANRAVAPLRAIPLSMNPPEHGKYRAVMARLFSPKSIDAMEAGVGKVCDDLMDKLIAKGETASFIEDFARPYPATIFMQLLGLPMDRQAEFIAWEKLALNSPTFEEGAKGSQLIKDYLLEVIMDRKEDPEGDDIVSLLVNAKIDGKPMSIDDIHGTCYLMFLAGLDTVTAGLMHIFYYLASHPDRKQELLDDPDLIPGAVEELFRYHSWIGSPRLVTHDFEYEGVKMKQGEMVNVSQALADHDPSEFENPETVDFHREPNPHFAFAAGVHRCIGSHLARRELRISVKKWLERAPDLHIKDGYEVTYMTQGMFHPLDLHLEWSVDKK